jgi:hypothetical protein
MMLVSPAQPVALCNLGWVDHGSVWRYDGRTGLSDRVLLSDASYLQLQAGSDDVFSAVHHFGGSRLIITVQPFSDPARTLAQVVVTGWVPTLNGDPGVWRSVPRHYIGWLDDTATGAAGYFLVAIGGGIAEVSRLDWFDAGAYDLGYQSVMAVAEVPDDGGLVYGVQRAGHLVLDSGTDGEGVRVIELAQRYGNPRPVIGRRFPDVWAVDYDTLVRLDRHTWGVIGSVQLQPEVGGTRMFIGELWLRPDENEVVVPRPGLGDVAFCNRENLAISRIADVGGQPLVAAVVSGRLVARDWKTGDLLVDDPA